MIPGHAQDGCLFGHPADADAENEPAARDHVQGGQLLGGGYRRAVGEDEHRGAQPDPVGAARDEQQRADGIQPAHVRRCRERPIVGVRVSRGDVCRPADVVADPQGVHAEHVALLDEGTNGHRIELAPEVGRVNADLHRLASLSLAKAPRTPSGCRRAVRV